jgi:hypothetical protein
LYAGGEEFVWTFDKNGMWIENRPGPVTSFCVHNNRLLDAGEYGVYHTVVNEPFDTHVIVQNICSIPQKLASEHAKRVVANSEIKWK